MENLVTAWKQKIESTLYLFSASASSDPSSETTIWLPPRRPPRKASSAEKAGIAWMQNKQNASHRSIIFLTFQILLNFLNAPRGDAVLYKFKCSNLKLVSDFNLFRLCWIVKINFIFEATTELSWRTTTHIKVDPKQI